MWGVRMSFGIEIFNNNNLNMVPRLPLYKYDTPLIPCSTRTIGITTVWTVPLSYFTEKGSLMALRLPENVWYNWAVKDGHLSFYNFYGSAYLPQPSFRVVSPSYPLAKSGYGLQIFDEYGNVLLDSDTELLKFSSNELVTATLPPDRSSVYIGSNMTDNGYIMIQSLMNIFEIFDVWEDLWMERRVDIMRVGRNYYASYYYANDPHGHYPTPVPHTINVKGMFAE